VVTRPEDAVANCFPGLECDIRNLDRRFFPGLVFEFVADGAKLAYVDALEDPDLKLPGGKELYMLLTDDNITQPLQKGHLLPGNKKQKHRKGVWYLDWIEQGGKRLSLHKNRSPMDSFTVWRLVRSLEPDMPLTIGLKLRNGKGGPAKGKDTYTFEGWRRRYTDKETGVINGAYQAGELGQGLCSPWQHDFRDCQCFYWAANHPDIVLRELYPGETLPPDDNAQAHDSSADHTSSPPEGKGPDNQQGAEGASAQGEPIIASIPVDWIRADRSRSLAAEALGTIAENRPYQFDHFQINTAWQQLSIVLESREIGGVYLPQSIETANPFRTTEELGAKLRKELAPLELALVFEYLYAYLSLLDEKAAQKKGGEVLRGAVVLARQHLMFVVTSEMQHLRWANQLLWELKLPDEFEPILVAADEVPTNKAAIEVQRLAREAKKARTDAAASKGRTTAALQQTAMGLTQDALIKFTQTERSGRSGSSDMRKAEERRLTPDVIQDFIAVEHPSGYIDGAYARVIATLQKFGHQQMAELAMRIAADGVQHEIRFREIKAALWPFFEKNEYLREVDLNPAKAQRALELLRTVKDNLNKAYRLAGNGALERSGPYIANARIAMTELLDEGEKLAARGTGIPFFAFWKSL
jgi:hypothetical protein